MIFMERDRRIEIALYERQYNSFVLAITCVKNMKDHSYADSLVKSLYMFSYLKKDRSGNEYISVKLFPEEAGRLIELLMTIIGPVDKPEISFVNFIGNIKETNPNRVWKNFG